MCLDALAANPPLRARLGQQGRAYVVRNFGWDGIVEKFRRLVERETRA